MLIEMENNMRQDIENKTLDVSDIPEEVVNELRKGYKDIDWSFYRADNIDRDRNHLKTVDIKHTIEYDDYGKMSMIDPLTFKRIEGFSNSIKKFRARVFSENGVLYPWICIYTKYPKRWGEWEK